jgi:hypothetical protein
MYADDVRISVSLATIEFVKGPEAAALRKGGTEQQLDLLTGYLERQAAADGQA